MKISNPEAKQDLTQRLQRIEGQVRGVRTMLGDERDCREIIQQLAAVHSAVQAASRVFLQEYATTCLVAIEDEDQPEQKTQRHLEREKIIRDMITLLDKAP